jgi:hypothetical protein
MISLFTYTLFEKMFKDMFWVYVTKLKYLKSKGPILSPFLALKIIIKTIS